MKKKLLQVLAVLTLSTSILLGACAPSQSSTTTAAANSTQGSGSEASDKETTAGSGEAVEISFWTMQLSPTFDDYIKGVITSFEKENPNIKVNWVDVPWGDMENKILSAAASSTMPDVANLNPHFSQKLAQLGALADMDELAGDVKADYVEGAWMASTYDDQSFGIPWYLTTGITFYNKALFEEAGLDPAKPPVYFEDIYEVAKTIKDKTGKYGYMPMFSDSHMLEDFEKGGVEIFNDDHTEVDFTSEKLVKTIEMYKKMFDEGLIPRDAFTKNFGELIQFYSSGEVAIFQGGTSHASMIETNSAEVYGNTGVGPQLLGKDGGKVNVAVMNLVIAKSSTKQEAAAKFAIYLTNAENQTEFSKVSGAILPSTLASLNDPFFALNETVKDQARSISAVQLPESEVIFPPMTNWSEVSKVLVDAVSQIILDNAEMMPTLEAAQEEANSLLQG